MTDKNGQASYRIVDVNGNPLPVQGRLGTVDVDVTQLSPLGQTEFMVGNTLAPASVLAQLRPGTGTLKPGEEELSNVDVTSTMVNMMAVINSYEANQRVLQTYDTELDKAVSDVGKVNA
ncbi:hypothetical protein GCM10025857_23450 [Alicyclobacillus contaminans]|nr:hypothetical protein GCM10025857_23450 [Alicyclobacillus contaminans]